MPARHSIAAAVCGALGAGGAAAVNLSTDGTGQVLLYPYYTSRAGFVTSFTVVNTNTAHTTVVKVRLREGKAAAPVLDFNLWLSPRDVWVASIVDTGSGAALYAPDNSCTVPALPNRPQNALPFGNSYYTGALDDNGGTSLDRTREGHIEVIEMGIPANANDLASFPASETGTALAAAVRNSPTGIPASCSTVAVNTRYNATDLRPPAGGLAGNAIIIGAATGTEFAYTATALQRFFRPAAAANLYTLPGDVLPDLSSVSPATSEIIADSIGSSPTTFTADWVAAGGQPVDAVSAVLMHASIMNEYNVSPGIRTDWILTQPTKRFYVTPATLQAGTLAPTPAAGPFANTFAATVQGGAMSCDPVFFQPYDREGAPYAGAQGVIFAVPMPAVPLPIVQACWSTTVMPVVAPGAAAADASSQSLFGSANAAALPLPAGGSASNYASGWIALFPTRTQTVASANSAGQVASGGGSLGIVINQDAVGGLRSAAAAGNRYRGLPVIGFAAIQASLFGQGYGGIFGHKYTINIAP